MEISELKTLLSKYRLHPNKVLGQNFLLNETILAEMAAAVPVNSGEAILEVGSGIGNLTARLLARGSFVLGVEKDPSFDPLLANLKRRHQNFQYAIADILKLDYLPLLENYPRYHAVGNVPYYLTGRVIQFFLRTNRKPASLTFMLQKEVADNLTAAPGRLNLLALSVQLYGQARQLRQVRKEDFYPAPKVDSALVQVALGHQARLEPAAETQLFRLLRACFAGKRKQMHNTLIHNLGMDKEIALRSLVQAGVNPAARPQELALTEWIQLLRALP